MPVELILRIVVWSANLPQSEKVRVARDSLSQVKLPDSLQQLDGSLPKKSQIDGYEIGTVHIVELAESLCDAVDMYEAFTRLASRAETLTVSNRH